MKEIKNHLGTIDLKGLKIPCYVTEDSQRLLSSRRLQDVLKIVETPDTGKQVSGGGLVRFFNQKSLEPLFSLVHDRSIFKPVEAMYGKTKILGYDAKILPEICNLMLKARRDGILLGSRQIKIAEQCEILLSAFATVGIIALVDEATGYQDIRKEDFLQKLLEKYLSPKRLSWAKKFPNDFYVEMFRLKSWALNGKHRPSIVGKYTNNIIYDRIIPSLLKELEKKNPKDDKGRRKNRHHQWLSSDIGNPELAKHLHAVIALMKTCKTWNRFMANLERVFPKQGDIDTLPIYFPFPNYEEED